jgi:predicted acetyltransferase
LKDTKIRALFKNDRKEFTFFFKLYLDEINLKKINKKKIAVMAKTIINNKDKKKFIFYNQNNIIGFVVATFYKNLINLNICKIEDFYIRKEFRKKRFGLELVKKFKRRIHYKKIKKFKIEILDKNHTAKKFWQTFKLKIISNSYLIDL